MTASIEVTGVADVNKLFKDIQLATGNTTEVLDEAAAIMLNRIRGRFLEAKDPDGNMWPASQGAKDRATPLGQTVGTKTYLDGLTLFRSGKLFHSIKAGKPSNSSRSIYTNISYGKYHNDGLGQVKRVFLGFSTQDVDILFKLAQKRLDEALN